MTEDADRPMTDPEGIVDDRDLAAYIDGELDADARAAVAAALEQSQTLRRRAGAFSAVDRAVKRYADALAASALPSKICIRRMAAERRGRKARRLGLAAAALFAVLIGVTAGWVGHGLFHRQAFATRTFVESAAAAHIVYSAELRHPVEVAAIEKQHLGNWLSKRLNTSFHAPNLTGVGFTLMGGRLLPTREGAPAAQLMYEDPEGKRLTIYAAANAGDAAQAFRYFKLRDDGPETLYWVEARARYALTGPFDRKMLLMLADAVLKGWDGA